MDVALFEGFEDLSLWSVSGSVDIAPGRNENALIIDSDTSPAFVQHLLHTANQSNTMICGFAYRYDNEPDDICSLVSFLSDDAATTNVTLSLTPSLTLQISAGDSTGPVLITSTQTLTANTWYYIEFPASLDSIAGSVGIRVDEEIWIVQGDVGTSNGSSNNFFDTVQIGCDAGHNIVAVFDDLYIATTDPPFLGDIRVETLYPNGNTTTSTWDGSDGNSVNNYQLVNSPGEPSMDTYIYNQTPYAYELFQFDNLTTTVGSVIGTTAVIHGKKQGDDDMQVSVVIELPDSTEESPGLILNDTEESQYVTMQNVEDDYPFTIPVVNNIKAGVAITTP